MGQVACPRRKVQRPVWITLEVLVFVLPDVAIRQALTKFEHMGHDLSGNPLQAGLELIFFLCFGNDPSERVLV